MPKNRILWIDDQISAFKPFVNALSENGYDVDVASNCAEATDIASKKRFDVILVDINMPAPNGIETIRRLVPIQKYAAFAVLSSFLYLQKYRDELSLLRTPIQLIDKILPNVHSETFSKCFLDPIKGLIERGVTFTIKDSNKATEKVHELDPFAISFNDFMLLSITEKDKLHDIAEQLAKATIENCLKRGKIWILLCGDRDEVVSMADTLDEIPNEEKVIEIAQKYNRAPYQFCQGLEADDHQWTSCASSQSLRDYPTVSIKFGDNELEMHFDTGCPQTLLSYEEFVGLRIINSSGIFINQSRKGLDSIKCKIENLTGLLKDQTTGETKQISLNAMAVRDWIDTSFARFCDNKCPKNTSTSQNDKRLCPLRKALIGRDLLIKNRLKLTLDGANRTTSFKGE